MTLQVLDRLELHSSEVLKRLLAELTPADRAILLLFLDDLGYDEMALILGASANQFEENRDALRCIDGFNLCMTGNCIDDHLRDGVIIENTYGSVASGNMIEECAGTAIVLDRDCYGIALSAILPTTRRSCGTRVSAKTLRGRESLPSAGRGLPMRPACWPRRASSVSRPTARPLRRTALPRGRIEGRRGGSRHEPEQGWR